MTRVLARGLVALGLAYGLISCTRSQAPSLADGGVVAKESEARTGLADLDLLRAENLRNSADLGAEPSGLRDMHRRRTWARAAARIGDDKSIEHLRVLLSDEDPETVAWSAYGLGHGCKGHEEDHVTRLVARAVGLRLRSAGARSHGSSAGGVLDPRTTIARAVGRCAARASETVLVDWLGDPSWRAAALAGLGDYATVRSVLGDRAITALLDAARAAPGPGGAQVDDLTFYALSRAKPVDALRGRVIGSAVEALERSGPSRIFAIKTLAKYADRDASKVAAALARVVRDGQAFDPAERAEAARALGHAGSAGREAAAGALGALVAGGGETSVGGSEFGVWHTLVGALGEAPPESAVEVLGRLSRLAPPGSAGPELRRRYAELRCAAALGLARGSSEQEVLVQCDEEGSEISQRARLASLVQRPLVRERRAAFLKLARSSHKRVREKAIEALGGHPELHDVASSILTEALGSDDAGLVAVAAEALHAHPELGMVLAASERRAGLDPKAPPPSTSPKKELSKQVHEALSTALRKTFSEDLFETRIAVVEAAAGVGHEGAKPAAEALCTDPNVTVRDRMRSILRALGADSSTCGASPRAPNLAPEFEGTLLANPVRIALRTDLHTLGMVLDPELSPVTATRIASLVRAKFYDGVPIHRVVPGFVAQFGDPQGDGYGGSGTSLRCETSPVPFDRFDVGMALAGRDTGSSQLFVTLARTPHLDGQYTRVGHATGDWHAVAQGEVIREARVEGDD